MKNIKKVLWEYRNRNSIESVFNDKMKLGFGFNRLPYKTDGSKEPDYDQINKIIDRYLQCGGKYFETGYNYMNYHSEDVVRKCLVERYDRKDFILCDKLPVRYNSTYSKGFESVFQEQMDKCGVSYFDVYLLHNVGRTLYEKLKKTGVFEFLNEKKAEGKVRFIGFSFHDKADTLDLILSEQPQIDLVQLQINWQDWESPAIQSKLCYEVATKHNKPISVMEPLKGGNLVNRLPDNAKMILQDAGYTPAEIGLRYVATLPNVRLVLSGMGSINQVEENISYLKEPYKIGSKEQDVVEKITTILESFNQIDCTNCGYCLDVCPKKIPINDIFRLINTETIDGKIINRNAKMFYLRNVLGKGKASDCIKCGRCEDICSQKIEIRNELEKAAEIFETKRNKAHK